MQELVDLLEKGLNSSDLQSILIEMARRRSESVQPSGILKEFRENRFLKPSEISQAAFNRIDRLAYRILGNDFSPIELSPVAPFGSCSSVTNLSQNLVISTIRHSEVLADPTNAMAIEASIRRKALLEKDPKSVQEINLCSSHRLIRAQSFGNEKFTAHFRVFALVTAGKDTGHFRFEISQLEEHIRFYLELCKQLGILEDSELRISDFSGKFDQSLLDPGLNHLKTSYPEVEIIWDNERTEARHYYNPVAFRIRFHDNEGNEWDLADGGSNDWTQIYLNNKKERLLSSAIGTELLLKVFPYIRVPD